MVWAVQGQLPHTSSGSIHKTRCRRRTNGVLKTWRIPGQLPVFSPHKKPDGVGLWYQQRNVVAATTELMDLHARAKASYCCPIGWLVSTVNLTGARIVDKAHFWAHLWGVLYIRLIETGRSTLNVDDTILLAAGKGEGSCCSQSSSLAASWCRYCVNNCIMLCLDSLAMMSCIP